MNLSLSIIRFAFRVKELRDLIPGFFGLVHTDASAAHRLRQVRVSRRWKRRAPCSQPAAARSSWHPEYPVANIPTAWASTRSAGMLKGR